MVPCSGNPEMVLRILVAPPQKMMLAEEAEETCQPHDFFPRKEYHNMLENIAGNSSMLVGKAAEVRCSATQLVRGPDGRCQTCCLGALVIPSSLISTPSNGV